MKPVPQSVYDRARLLATSHDIQTVAMIIGKQPTFVSRMKKRGWKAIGSWKKRRPNDFAIQARHLNHRELMKHYGAGGPTITRWLREIRT